MTGARHTVSGTRSTSGDGDAVIAAPGADYQVRIYDGALLQVDPGNDDCTVIIKSGSTQLYKAALSGGVYGVARLPELISGTNEAIYVNLSTDADVAYTLTYSLRSTVHGNEK